MYSREVFESLRPGAPSVLRTEKEGLMLRFRSASTLSEVEGLTKLKDDVNILIRSLRKKIFSALAGSLRNDLEIAIVRLQPSLALLKQKLGRLTTHGVGFSGSGPALFVLAEDRKKAESLKSALNKEYRRVFVVGTF